MSRLISRDNAKREFEQKQEQLFEDLISQINEELINRFSESSPIVISVMIPEIFQHRIRKMFAESKEWNLIVVMSNSIQVKARDHG